MAQAFFGLTSEDKEIYLEPIFYLVYYLGVTYAEAYNMAIWKRNWYLERVIKEIKNANGDSKGARAEERGLASKGRPDGPHRTRRFT